ncbi:actin nucleation-promoting factor WAS-like isoform X2 [Bubalus kerabau]|uniref:actin nucleation-promoting factor WAS-like isoform X2 n=1 Tax=Bubalus carabanensis TaxID=3119969 RepID=UPI00244E7228|nr:actin nucleation-promoting factor WAS-like isoform X2 [Bubalus carabanensis]
MHAIRIQGPRPLRPPSPAAGLGSAARTYRDPPGRRAHCGGPSAARRSGPSPPPALRLLAPRPGCGSHLPPLSPSGAGLGRRLSRREPRAPPLVLSGPLRPLPLASARGAWPQRARLPRPLLHASWAQRRRRLRSLRRFLRSGDRGQDLQTGKDEEEKSYSSFTGTKAPHPGEG